MKNQFNWQQLDLFYSNTAEEISSGHRNSDAPSPDEAINGGDKLQHADGGFRRHISYENPAPRPPGAGQGQSPAAGGQPVDGEAGHKSTYSLDM